ncbi:uncharacterized protein K444DRAFT_620586 [Hyaloscypha bicolor E]|uniref:Uncharacterized protein n=1 Tax=Hyaloscypha bicolor E TaxID=1095630 RepID=A0A2J6SL34_9HELO|nr:uncharacterized protein K444DRAFT_620586 [Hyaloscypha bicolor E]PMD51483.1 hypothetical protein K444DRAFT_620586 [Hyaloscypha bicolor E]
MNSSRTWVFAFPIIIYLCTIVEGLPTASPNINVTISVPAGTSDHGDPNLLCTPTKWFDIFTFYLANYFAHAATVKALPGESTTDLAFAVFLAIAFPFSGIARGLQAIARHASFSWGQKSVCGDLQTAARAGALCIVVRNEYWDGRGLSIERVKQTIDQSKHHLEYISPTARKIHGLSKLSEGYSLAILPSNAEVVPSKPHKEGYQQEITLSSSASIPQSMVAIFQVLYASYTLYKTRGDQLNRYGYAAFGLTVIPYIIMSFLNLLGNVSTPDYPALYLVGSAELEEARLKQDTVIDGVIGKVVPVGWGEDSKDYFMGLDRWSLSHKDGHAKTYLAECSPFKTMDGEQPYRGPKPLRRASFLWWGFMILLGTIPYAVIGSLTQFHAAESTEAERVLTMFWLASGVLIGATIPFIGFTFHEMVEIIKGSFSQKAWNEARRARQTAEAAKKDADEAMEAAQATVGIANETKRVADKVAEDAKEAREVLEERKEDLEKAQHEFDSQRSAAVTKTDSQLQMLYDARDSLDKKWIITLQQNIKAAKEPSSALQTIQTLQTKSDALYHEYKDYQIEAEIAKDRATEKFKFSRRAMLRAEDLAKAEEDRAKAAVVFLISLMFCAGAIGGFVVVGQMLKDYGSCLLLS